MSIGNGERHSQQTKLHAVRLASQKSLWQSGTSDLEHRSTVFSRDRILSGVGLSLTRLRQGTLGSAAAPLIVDRLPDASVVAAHGCRDRSDVLHRGIPRRGTATDDGPTTSRCNAIRTDFAPHC